MTIDDIHQVLNYIADTDDQCADVVFYALTLLDTSVGNMRDSVKNQIYTRLEQNDFSEVDPLNKYCKDITELKDGIYACLNALIRKHPDVKIPNSETVKHVVENTDNNHQSENPGTFPVDYSLYTVNQMEPHHLDEDFEHKKVCAYTFCGKDVIVKNWKDLLVSLCSLLNQRNPALFASLISNAQMQGKRISYFVKTPTYTPNGQIRETLVPGSDLYVYTNASANAIKERVKVLLAIFNCNSEEFIVFLRADYSSLH